MKKAIIITFAVLLGVTGVLATGAHLVGAAQMAFYDPDTEEDDDDDIY